MTEVVMLDEREITITPVFKYAQLENVPKSEAAGYAVMEMHEVVEVRFAGSKNYSPVFPVHERWQRIGNRDVTYAERWGEQYRAFKEGSPQEALGTPLEMLRPYGVTPEQLALCRALKIYSIEALYHLEGQNLKSLGMNQNKLKEAAALFIAERDKGKSAIAELETLRARVAELESRSTAVPEQEPTREEIDAAVQQADDAYAELTDDQLKERIAAKAGRKPAGNPSRATLVQSLQELEAA